MADEHLQSVKSSQSILKSAGAMGSAVFISRILGLVREQVFAAMFGASDATDAFQMAYRIPNLLRDLFAEGAMSAALVPTFIQVQKREGEKRAWQLATRVFVVLFVWVAVLAVVGIIFAGPLVRLYAGAFQSIPGKLELTISMTRTMMPFFPLVALAASFMAILNACGKFFVPSFATALFNLVSITVGVTLAHIFPAFGRTPIEGMAYGVVAGGLAQALLQWPFLKKQGYVPAWNTPLEVPALQDPALRKLMLLMIPGTLGLAATQINILINSIFATSLGPGAVSWLNYSFRLMQFPIGIFGVSLAAAVLPVFSHFWSEHHHEAALQSLTQCLRRVFAINFAASAGLIALAIPIISLIFEHGKFHALDTLATAHALCAYAFGLTAYSVIKVLVPICYALGMTRKAVFSSVFSVCSNLIFNFLFVKKLGFVGLAFGTSLTAVLNAALLWRFVSQKLSSMKIVVPTRGLLKAAGEFAVSAFVMGVVVWCVDNFLWKVLNLTNPFWLRGLRVALGVFLGLSVYLGVSILLELQESLEILDLFKRRLGRGRS